MATLNRPLDDLDLSSPLETALYYLLNSVDWRRYISPCTPLF